MTHVTRPRPAYTLKSVDKALELIEVLRDAGELRLVDAAEELGVAPSSAHRLLQMLVYRGYAVQDADRIYRPGPAFGQRPVSAINTRLLRSRLQPHLDELSAMTGYTTTAIIRVDSSARILMRSEGANLPRPGGYKGTVLPIDKTASGRALLAELEQDQVRQILTLADSASTRLEGFIDELPRVRASGFAASTQTINGAVFSVSAPVHSRGTVLAAVAISLGDPRSERSERHRLVEWILRARAQIDADLAHSPLD